MHGIKVFLIFLSTIWINIGQGWSQNRQYDILEIPRFISEMNNHPSPFQFDQTNLSTFKLNVYWGLMDKRFAHCFKERLHSYVDKTNVSFLFQKLEKELPHWPAQHFPIFVVGKDQNLPQAPKGLIIDINDKNRASETQLPYYRFSSAFPHCMNFDLLAQYLFKAIKINQNQELENDQRLSFLPAQYLGVDEKELTTKLDQYLQKGLDSMAYPGAQVIVAYRGSVIYQRAVGYHTYDRILRVRPTDVYDLASVTKVVAGVNALMGLYDLEKFDLKAPLKAYFPYFEKDPKGDLDFYRILSHSAGLEPYMVYYLLAEKKKGKFYRKTFSSHYRKKYNYAITQNLYVSDDFLKFIKKNILKSRLNPQGKYVYSGLSFLLYPELVKQQTGVSIDDFLRENYYDPIGADRITYNPLEKFHPNEIVPTEYDSLWRQRLVHGTVHDEAAAVLKGVSTNAGLFANALDLAKMGEVWRRKGQYGGHQYWQSQTIETFTQCAFCTEGNRRALGFDRRPDPKENIQSYMSPFASDQSFGHSGFTGTMIWVDPTYEYTFVFLSNRVHPTRKNTKIYQLNLRPDLHSVLYLTLNQQKENN